jgi:hypothetical protein
MMNPPGNRDVGNTISIPFVRIFDNSEAVDQFIKNVDLELSKRSNIKLFIVSDNQIISQDSTKFEIRINIVMDNLNISNGDHTQKFLNTIKPSINRAYNLSSQANRSEYHSPPPNLPAAADQKQNEYVQSYPRNQSNHSWIRKIERNIKDPSFLTLFPFLGFFALVIIIIATVVIGGGQPSKDPSENSPLQNLPENREPSIPSSSPSIPPSSSPSLSPSKIIDRDKVLDERK